MLKWYIERSSQIQVHTQTRPDPPHPIYNAPHVTKATTNLAH